MSANQAGLKRDRSAGLGNRFVMHAIRGTVTVSLDALQIVLADEVSRRDHGRLELRLRQAGFEQLCRLEDFDWSASIRLDRRLLHAACSLRFLDRREHVLLVGPVGVGKSFLAQALGYAAVRSGRSVRFVSADQYFRELAQAPGRPHRREGLPQLPCPRPAGDPHRGGAAADAGAPERRPRGQPR